MLLILGACSNPQVSPSPRLEAEASPSTAISLPPTPSPSITKGQTPSEVTKILPTSTPTLYTVKLNDTLTGIARKFNITLEEIITANPSVDSQALIVGQILVIPLQQIVGFEPSATPWPVSIHQTHCYPNQDGSLWCLVLLKNVNTDSLQNLAVQINLLDSTGKVVNEKTTFPPLDLLPSGKVTVLGALFSGPIPVGYKIQTQIQSASILPSADGLYLPVHLQNYLAQVDWAGISAVVSGQVFLDEKSDPAEQIRILAVAYDRSGKVIGFRLWESNDHLSHGDVLSFEFGVTSLGPEIDHIDLLVEATRQHQ